MTIVVRGIKIIHTGEQEISCHLCKYSFSKEGLAIIMVARISYSPEPIQWGLVIIMATSTVV
jgi:hypothetical protein